MTTSKDIMLEPVKTNGSAQKVQVKLPGISLNAAIVGGGKGCEELLKILDEDRLSRLNMKILGVADVNPEAPGFLYAEKLNLFITTNYQDLFDLKGLNLIIEITGSREVRDQILQTKPPEISLIDHIGSRLLWDLVQIEMEKSELEKARLEDQEKSKKHIQVILDSLPYRIMVVNMDMTIDTVNQTFYRDFDLTPEEVLGRPCYKVRYDIDEPCTDDGKICFLVDRPEEIKEKGLFSTIREYQDEKGNTRFDAIRIVPILDEKGKIVQILEGARDVTDRIQLEREVEKSNVFLQHVIQSAVDGIVVVDRKGYILLFNEGMQRLTGYPPEEIMEKGHLSAFYDMEVARESMRKMRSDQYGPPGKLNPISITIKTKDGERIPVTLSASIIIIDGKETGNVGVFTDMREILEMRKDLEEARLQLVQSEKIALVGKMAAGVAHELNNPLSGVLLYAELLKEELKDNSQHLADIQEAINQTLRCKKIVAELLEFSRQSVGKVSTFNLGETVKKTLNLLINKALFYDIKVNLDIAPDLPDMVGDTDQLQQVFANLFLNAADAMEGKGKLDIKARYSPEKNEFRIEVSDSGPGIPEPLRDKIFDIFFTTKPVGKGTGIGLSFSQNIIKLHGGNITVECPPEGGTTFIIMLPLGIVEEHISEPLFIGLDE
ncbi:MAG TPA: ATP-binding protein [Acidobacteriota bacterium]|nr:ATP-binding protein [Acidobacteriota bacterium]